MPKSQFDKQGIWIGVFRLLGLGLLVTLILRGFLLCCGYGKPRNLSCHIPCEILYLTNIYRIRGGYSSLIYENSLSSVSSQSERGHAKISSHMTKYNVRYSLLSRDTELNPRAFQLSLSLEHPFTGSNC